MNGESSRRESERDRCVIGLCLKQCSLYHAGCVVPCASWNMPEQLCLISTLLKTVIHYIPSCQSAGCINVLDILWPLSPTEQKEQGNIIGYSHEIMEWYGMTNCSSPCSAGNGPVQRKWNGTNFESRSISLFFGWNFIWWCEILQQITWLRRRQPPIYKNVHRCVAEVHAAGKLVWYWLYHEEIPCALTLWF